MHDIQKLTAFARLVVLNHRIVIVIPIMKGKDTEEVLKWLPQSCKNKYDTKALHAEPNFEWQEPNG